MWLPLVAALIAGVLGAAGVIAGQLVNARRESKRWQVERSAKTLDYWRDTKLKAYSDLVGVLHRWNELFFRHVNWPADGLLVVQDHVLAEMDQLAKDLDFVMAGVYLVGSREVQTLSEEVGALLRRCGESPAGRESSHFPAHTRVARAGSVA
ncbi:hypothetical protein ACFWNN_24060 [Lentzea sp. NPDC058450]|uniref:hypothetical protein n=1 Tax=Lentzea sp. NPDC058450 TaxID=3346505 RepID=UPI0036657A79